MDYNEYIGPIPGKIHNLGSADTDLKTLLGYNGNPVDVSALNDGRSLPEVTVVRINGNDYSLGDMLKDPLERLLGYIRDTVPTAGISEGQIIYTKDDHKLKVCNQVGKKEVDTLTVTVGSTGAGDLIITLNGVNATVAVDALKTADEIAAAIRAASFPGWTVTGDTDEAIFTKDEVGIVSAPEIAVGDTSVEGEFVRTATGDTTTLYWQEL